MNIVISRSFVDLVSDTNRPFPSSLMPLFQNESRHETFQMKMSSARLAEVMIRYVRSSK